MLPANLGKLSNDQLYKYLHKYENELLFKGKVGVRAAWVNYQSFQFVPSSASLHDNDDDDDNTLRLWRCCRSHCCSSTPPSTPHSPDAVNVIMMIDHRDRGDDVEHLPSPPSYRHQ